MTTLLEFSGKLKTEKEDKTSSDNRKHQANTLA